MPNPRRLSPARTRRTVVMLCLAAAACAPASPAPASGPRALLERAITQAGGAEALGRANALLWEGDATVYAGGRTVRIAGTWAVQPPDTAVVATYDVTRGPETTRALVVAAPRGWIARGTELSPMPDAMLANERDEFYLYQVMRLVSLRDAEVTLTAVAADSLGQAGFRAERPGRPAVELYFDGSGRLAHLRTTVQDAGGGSPVRQDLWLSGSLQAQGIRWPATIRITMNGAPYFDLSLRNLRIQPRLDDPRLRGP
ncbi:hypothetical protein [Longimicrobium sp.]|uniref:hypothetical protein n=1 Tax=Longimicrobium sp. TaxID=2029185 RepID=UPI003B3AA235